MFVSEQATVLKISRVRETSLACLRPYRCERYCPQTDSIHLHRTYLSGCVCAGVHTNRKHVGWISIEQQQVREALPFQHLHSPLASVLSSRGYIPCLLVSMA